MLRTHHKIETASGLNMARLASSKAKNGFLNVGWGQPRLTLARTHFAFYGKRHSNPGNIMSP